MFKVYTAVSSINDSTVTCDIKSAIVFFVYTYLMKQYDTVSDIQLCIVIDENLTSTYIDIDLSNMNFKKIERPITQCSLPIFLKGNENFFIAGLCAVIRQLVKSCTNNHYETKLLGFREASLAACAESSTYTKFCEIDLINSVEKLAEELRHMKESKYFPEVLWKLNSILKKPAVVPNIGKKSIRNVIRKSEGTPRVFMEGLHICLSDIITLPVIHMLWNFLNLNVVRNVVPLTVIWYENIRSIASIRNTLESLHSVINLTSILNSKNGNICKNVNTHKQEITKDENMSSRLIDCAENLNTLESTTNISELKDVNVLINGDSYLNHEKKQSSNIVKLTNHVNDMKIYDDQISADVKYSIKNEHILPKVYTKQKNVEDVLHKVNTLQLQFGSVNYSEDFTQVDWDRIPHLAQPKGGNLPDNRLTRKMQQIESMVYFILKLAKINDTIVDFCSGLGHLGILLAYLLPQCNVILLDNRDFSLNEAQKRISNLNLKNIFIIQSNVDYFIGNFQIGVALHACGLATDLVISKCIKLKANFVVSPCCYGKVKKNHMLLYPRSNQLNDHFSHEEYMILAHAADQTHKCLYNKSDQGEKCMDIVDTDRCLHAQENTYVALLYKMTPLSCTTKHNIIVGMLR